MKILFLILFFFLPIAGSVANVDELFAEANAAFSNGEYAQSIDLYNQCLDEGQSVSLLFNLGNAYFENGDVGHAILSYEKGLLLNPNNADLLANLKFAKEFAEAEESEPTYLDKIAFVFSVIRSFTLL